MEKRCEGVKVNGVPGVLHLKGNVARWSPDPQRADASDGGEASGEVVFPFSQVRQLLRGRKDNVTAKVVFDGSHVVLVFGNAHDRELFISAVASPVPREDAEPKVKAQPSTATQTPPTDVNGWMAEAMYGTAVDCGLVDKDTLALMMSETMQRGVVHSFDAIETLVDPATLSLRPITEQMASDVFRQTPLLARIFESFAKDEESRTTFWEALVKKYFCFSRTFLEDEIQRLEPLETSSRHGAPAAAGDATENGQLASINNASLRALPKQRARGSLNAQSELGEEEDGAEAEFGISKRTGVKKARRFESLFTAVGSSEPEGQCRDTTVACACSPATLAKGRYAAPLPPLIPVKVHAAACAAPVVARRPPAEKTDKALFELLRKYWAGDQSQRESLREAILAAPLPPDSLVQRNCVQRLKQLVTGRPPLL